MPTLLRTSVGGDSRVPAASQRTAHCHAWQGTSTHQVMPTMAMMQLANVNLQVWQAAGRYHRSTIPAARWATQHRRPRSGADPQPSQTSSYLSNDERQRVAINDVYIERHDSEERAAGLPCSGFQGRPNPNRPSPPLVRGETANVWLNDAIDGMPYPASFC